MKNILKYTLAALVGLSGLMATSSCSEDNLDIVQRGVSGTDTYLTGNDETVESFIGAVYTKFRGDYSSSSASFGGDGTSSWGMFNLDLQQLSDEDCDAAKYNESSESDRYKRTWSYFYTICYWCNMIIENVPNNTVASADVRTRVVAEARAMRALSMMYLTQLFGNAPLADHVMSGSEGNSDASANWSWIDSEFEAAATALPSKSGKDGQNKIGGRFTKEACYAYEGRGQLWRGDYDKAAQTLDKVISSGLYELEANFDDLNLSKSDFGPENIFEFNFDDQEEYLNGQETSMDIYAFGCNQVMCYGVTFPLLYMNWGNGSNPTQELYDFYLEHDSLSSPRMNGCILSKAMFDAYTYGYHGMTFPVANNQGYFRMRHICRADDKVGAFPLEFSKKNTVYLRYADVLLDYAEAVANGGKEGSLSGLEALNLVRRRAGIDDAPSLDMNNAIYGIKAERRAEFYHEGDRFIDVVRWGDGATAFANVGKNTYQFVGTGEPGNYDFTTTSTGFGGWKDQYKLFPIPSTDINNNPSLNQNAGW